MCINWSVIMTNPEFKKKAETQASIGSRQRQRASRQQEWERYIMDAISPQIPALVTCGAAKNKEDAAQLVSLAVENNRKNEHFVFSSLKASEKMDEKGEGIGFTLQFLAFAPSSAFFINKLFADRPEIGLGNLKNALKTIHMRNRLTPESGLWERIECDEVKFAAIMARAQPVFDRLTQNGKMPLTRMQAIDMLEWLGSDEKCETKRVVPLVVKRARNGEGTLPLATHVLCTIVDIGFKDLGFSIDLYDSDKNPDDFLLGAFKLSRVVRTPHPLYIERGSGPVFHNGQIKSVCSGYYRPLRQRSFVFDKILDQSDLIGRLRLPSEIEVAPHEMEHSIQQLLGLGGLASKWKEFGAEAAALLSMGEKLANQMLNSWVDRAARNKFMDVILGNGLAELAAKFGDIVLIGEMRAMIQEEVRKIKGMHPRMPTLKILRNLLDKLYEDELKVTYTVLETAAEKIFDKEAATASSQDKP